MKTSQKQISLFTEEQLTCLPEGSLVNPIPLQDLEKGMKMNAISGQKCLEQFERLNHIGLWAKTFSALLVGMEGWYSRRSRLIWKLKGTKYNRMYFQLVAPTPRTKGIEFGLLPTVQAIDGKGKGRPLRKKTGNRDYSKIGNWRGDLKRLCVSQPITDTKSIRRRKICNACKKTRPRKSDVLFVGKYRVSANVKHDTYANFTKRKKLHISSIPIATRFSSRCNYENTRSVIAYSHSFRQWEKIDRNRKAGFFDKESETDDWKNFPTQSPICSGDDGISPQLDGIAFSAWRNNSIEGYGNAIVPALVLRIFKAIEEYELMTN